MYHTSKELIKANIEVLEATADSAPYETTVIGALVGWGITLLWFRWGVIPSIIGIILFGMIGWIIGMSHRHKLLEDARWMRKEMKEE